MEYQIERSISMNSTPVEYEIKEEFDTPEQVTKWLFAPENQPVNNPAFCGQQIRVITPWGDVIDKRDWVMMNAEDL